MKICLSFKMSGVATVATSDVNEGMEVPHRSRTLACQQRGGSIEQPGPNRPARGHQTGPDLLQRRSSVEPFSPHICRQCSSSIYSIQSSMNSALNQNTGVIPNEGQVTRNASFLRYSTRSRISLFLLSAAQNIANFIDLEACPAALTWPSFENTAVLITIILELGIPFTQVLRHSQGWYIATSVRT
jgi:hypothetical protein